MTTYEQFTKFYSNHNKKMKWKIMNDNIYRHSHSIGLTSLNNYYIEKVRFKVDYCVHNVLSQNITSGH